MVRQRDVERSPSSPNVCRFSAKRWSKSPIQRSVIAAPSVGVWSTPIPLRSCRCSPSPWTQLSICAARGWSRSVTAKDFYQGYLLTDIAPDELLLAIDFHLPPADCGWCSPRSRAGMAILPSSRCGAARLRARSKDRLCPRRAWWSRSGAAAHERRRNRRSWVSGLTPTFFAGRAILRRKRWIRRPTSTLLRVTGAISPACWCAAPWQPRQVASKGERHD